MKVLQVIPAYFPATVYGGPIFSIHFACQALARAGVSINVATTNANGRTKLRVPTDKAVVFEQNYLVRYYDDTIIGRFSWQFTLKLRLDIRRASVVHLQDIYSLHAAETLILGFLFAKPLVISPRGVFSSWASATKRRWLKKLWLWLLVRPFVRNPSRVAWHATSVGERDEILSVFPGCKVHVVPNAIDCAAFDGTKRLPKDQYLARFFPACAVTPDKVTVLACMGRLHRIKGFDVAIEALALVKEEFPNAVLLIAGGDEGEQGALERLIIRLGLQGRATLVGTVLGKDKVAFLKGADLFMFPSHSENFGLACLEALAAELPVIASRTTPWSEIEARGCGLCVDNVPRAFAAALKELLVVDLVGFRGKARALAGRYDLAEVATSFREIYEDLAHGHVR